MELVIDDPSRFDLRYTAIDPFDKPAMLASQFQGWDHDSITATNGCMLLDIVYGDDQPHYFVQEFYRNMLPEYPSHEREDIHSIPWIDQFIEVPAWNAALGLAELREVVPVMSDQYRYGFHIPITVRLDGRSIPGYAIHHHLAHAAISFYRSDFSEAAILTNDGFGIFPGYHSGMYYLGKAEGLYPLWPHHLTIGYLYEQVSAILGLGAGGSSGKLMGLAGHGSPRFFDSRFVGNCNDFQGTFTDVSRSWIEHCLDSARSEGYDLSRFSDPRYAMVPVNADIAASTQKLFEMTRSEAVRSLKSQLDNMDQGVSNLCLGGGTALNCPSNSSIALSFDFESTYVDPACDDSGVAIGAALAAYHSILGLPRVFSRTNPYLGPCYPDTVTEDALAALEDSIVFERQADPAISAAADLDEGLIIGWFEGGSECGPRALGHRSILADPRQAENALRVNQIKGREVWRPFAPAVLVKEASAWFENVPIPSPYMLFNAFVKSNLIPAVTHVDHSARIQTVDRSCGKFYELIEHFYTKTGVPVVLNTSLNGPGEPIVETPRDALALLLSRNLDVLYLGHYRVVRLR